MQETGWVCVAFLLWGAFVVWFWDRRSRAQKRGVDESWGDLALLNGLTYTPAGSSLLGILSASPKPSVSGEHRGRRLRLTVAVENASTYDGYVSLASTVIALQVNNRADCSLVVQEKGLLRRVFGEGKEAHKIEGLDPRFIVKGGPPEFVERAHALIGLIVRQRTTLAVNQSPFFWTSQSKLPSIRLEGPELIWQQYDVVADANELNELFNLLCDLADLAEEETKVPEAASPG